MTRRDEIEAARLAMPADAHLTGITRIQAAGLDFGPHRPLRFVVARDHHIALDGIFLHRTKRLPPTDALGVTPTAAFLAYCAGARVLDAVKVGDWLLHHDLISTESVRTLALAQLWRDGAHEALWILDHLDGRSRSVKESETRAVLEFAGLPRPAVNHELRISADVTVIGDLVYVELSVFVEFEGRHHQEDRTQYHRDIDRYTLLREAGQAYVQVTTEKLSRPTRLVGEVFRAMVAQGYAGPPPSFDDRWRQLFLPVSLAVGPRRERIRNASSAG